MMGLNIVLVKTVLTGRREKGRCGREGKGNAEGPQLKPSVLL